MATKSISQLDTAESLALGDLFEIAIPDGNSATGYSSRKTSLTNIADFTQSTAANNELDTTSKTIVGAINEEDSKKFSWEENKASGVKNYFQYPFYPHALQGSPRVNRGVTFTDIGNGKILIDGVNDNTGNSFCQLMNTTQGAFRFVKLPAGHYHFSGGISADCYINLSTGLETNPTDRTEIGTDYGSGFDFEVTESQAQNNIFCSFAFVAKGKSVDNLVMYPLITRYEDTSTGFAEYAMTNIELTKLKTDMDSIAPTESSGIASKAYSIGDYMFWRGGFYKVTAAISQGGAITSNTNVVKTTIGAELKAALTT